MIRERFDTPERVMLDLRLPEGSIELETVDGAATAIELDARGHEDEIRELLEGARVEAREIPGGHEVIVDVEDRRRIGFGFWRRVDVRLSVRAPHGAEARIDSASADARARGRLGALEATTASGDIEVDEVTGDAAIKSASANVEVRSVGGAAVVTTASGDVELGRVDGHAVVKTASGDVTIRDAGATVTVTTASGDQRIEAVGEGAVTLQSASGDIEVGIRKGSNLWVDARAMSGETSSELELSDAPPEDDAPLVELRATSMSGDIRVVRAPAAAQLTE
jgi:DUF4097 and DUF4098 domain-containing protein YvlB